MSLYIKNTIKQNDLPTGPPAPMTLLRSTFRLTFALRLGPKAAVSVITTDVWTSVIKINTLEFGHLPELSYI